MGRIRSACVAAALLVSVVACGGEGGGASEDRTIEGSISLVTGAYNQSDPCSGNSGQIMSRSWDYTDMTGGAPVRILDADGTVLGSGALSEGDYREDSGFCRFTFSVPIDRTADRYQLVVGTRPPFDFQPGDDLNLQIGGN